MKHDAKHTPGPWTYVGSACVEAGQGPSRFQFLLARKGAGAPPDEWAANARLIAEAPAMLEALFEVRAAIYRIEDQTGELHAELHGPLDTIADVLSRATGESVGGIG